MEEGRRNEQIEQLKRDIERARDSVADLERRLGVRDIDVGKIVTKLSALIKAVDSMSAKIDRHLEAHASEAGA